MFTVHGSYTAVRWRRFAARLFAIGFPGGRRFDSGRRAAVASPSGKPRRTQERHHDLSAGRTDPPRYARSQAQMLWPKIRGGQ